MTKDDKISHFIKEIKTILQHFSVKLPSQTLFFSKRSKNFFAEVVNLFPTCGPNYELLDSFGFCFLEFLNFLPFSRGDVHSFEQLFGNFWLSAILTFQRDCPLHFAVSCWIRKNLIGKRPGCFWPLSETVTIPLVKGNYLKFNVDFCQPPPVFFILSDNFQVWNESLFFLFATWLSSYLAKQKQNDPRNLISIFFTLSHSPWKYRDTPVTQVSHS